jgi:hypothetical protein
LEQAPTCFFFLKALHEMHTLLMLGPIAAQPASFPIVAVETDPVFMAAKRRRVNKFATMTALEDVRRSLEQTRSRIGNRRFALLHPHGQLGRIKPEGRDGGSSTKVPPRFRT